MSIFEAIINCQTEEVKRLIENKLATAYDLEPNSFISKEGNVVHRKKPKTALQIAEFLGRNEIVEYLKLTNQIEINENPFPTIQQTKLV